ncbi:MAG: family 78 glycoside hydrolase catalytic domain [Anaerolineae bacterium]|nr:family 78 glycoside hydrolase catalytic domain [Anaerolineae bacterium]
MDWQARWIWINGESSPRNFHLCARRSFHVAPDLAQARLAITADSRYVLYLNGERLGRGPVRSFPSNQRYDIYNVTARLRPGRNVLAVLVRHFGESTFQYILGRGGLLAQLDLIYSNGREEAVVTDTHWRVCEHRGYAKDAPRVSIQQDFEEQFDAMAEPQEWIALDYDDSGWSEALELGPAGMAPWTGLSPREIPFLTEEPVTPMNVLWARVVRPPALTASIDYRVTLTPSVKDANLNWLEGLLATVIHSDRSQRITLRRHWGLLRLVRLDGREINLHEGDVSLSLDAGDHLLLIDVTGRQHLKQCTVVIEGEDPSALSFRALPGLPADLPWATAGPFGDDVAAHQALWACTTPEALRPYLHWFQPVPRPYFTHQPVAAITSLQHEVSGGVPHIIHPELLCALSDDVTTIFPAPEGGDTEILIDFGRELTGFLDFELEAPAGAILDFNLFEAIEDGRIHYTESGDHGLHNALRYRTRQGWQRYTAVSRRGFRYALLTVRNPSGPVHIRRLTCLLSTYPLAARGAFQCSDPLLNQIWEMSRYTLRLCSEDTFVDCPAYEQSFWVGDARNEALILYTGYGDLRLARHCWLLAAESLARSPLVESQVPSGWQNILTAWSLLWVLACEEFYRYSGDLDFVRQIYPALRQQAENIRGFLNQDGLLEIQAWNMLDWAPMDTPSAGVVTHQNAWLVEALRRTAYLAEILGETTEAKRYSMMAESLKAAINTYLWSEEHQAYIDSIHADGTRSPVVSQQTNTVVYLCDVATPERLPLIERYVREVPEGWVRIGSPFMMFFTFEALAKMGDFETILEITRQRWGEMLEKGATTCWETFPGFDPHWWTRSHCHGWSAAPTFFLSTYQLGVQPLTPGFGQALIAPMPAGLRWVHGRMPTPHGEIAVNWRQENDRFEMNVVLPMGTAGLIRLPPLVPQAATVEVTGAQPAAWSTAGWEIEAAAGSQIVVVAHW